MRVSSPPAVSRLDVCFLVRAFALFLTFLRQREHFLLVLLAFELAGVAIIGLLLSRRGVWAVFFPLLVVGACEGALGLAILVLMVRTHGNDRLASVHANKGWGVGGRLPSSL